MQTTSHILMIRPVNFGYNPQTAVNNAFQVADSDPYVQQKALEEFDRFVKVLQQHKVDVTVVQDTPDPQTPDSIFPNNWISFHEDGGIVLYPMYAENRRLERKQHVLDTLDKKFIIRQQADLSFYEASNRFLEGTGSMVLDRENKIAYACLSPRTDKTVLDDFCNRLGYQPVVFTAVDTNGTAIYHTNVMMCVADRYVVICLDAIPNEAERKQVTAAIRNSGKAIIPIRTDQIQHFAGNMLQVENEEAEKLLVMSTQAYESLDQDQINQLLQFNDIVHSPLTVIEKNGGGSARCMMAEVHLPIKPIE
jgi:hypothetical protein